MAHIYVQFIEIFLVSIAAGVVGALLGLGGGILIIPALTLFLGIDYRLAAGASIVSIIATSSGAAAAFVRDRLSNIRVGMFLNILTSAGATRGAYLAGRVQGSARYIAFALVLLYSLYPLGKKILAELKPRNSAAELKLRRSAAELVPGSAGAELALGMPGAGLAVREEKRDALAKWLGFSGSYFDPAKGSQVEYHLHGVPAGAGIMYAAGIASGMLGIGSGVFKVLALDTAMGMPLKASSATSNFMIGVTAAASATIYFLRGDIDPLIAAPVALGVLAGSSLGSRLLARLAGESIRLIFFAVLAFIAVQMLLRGLGIRLL
jgi:uncharacterized protein